MRLSALRTRILTGAVLTAALAFLMVVITVRTTLESRFPVERAISDDAYRACLDDPMTWSSLAVGPQQVRAFDESGQPADPTLGPLDLAGIGLLEVGDTHQWHRGPSRTLVRRMGHHGPCTYMTVTLSPPPELRAVLPWALALGTFLAVLVVGMATYAFTVLPLVRRIERIREAAVEVGRDSYRSGDDQVGDPLSDIAQVLDASQSRIVEDREELVRRHEALERHMAELAHDLRTPLASLLLALQDVEADATLDSRNSVRRALQDTSYVSTLVENLHQAARLRHGLDPQRGVVDLREVVHRLEIRFQRLGHVDQVEVAASLPERPVPVRCTPSLAERAIGNLLDNAVRHGAAHAAVLLSAQGHRFELVVVDDGSGVPDTERALLGQRTFTRDPARPREHGLGLAITNEIAKRAGWSLRYDRSDEGGLKVTVSGKLYRTVSGSSIQSAPPRPSRTTATSTPSNAWSTLRSKRPSSRNDGP
ncbi:MAG: HAMP domain-containing histidine kinase [Myxococcales bacterium]|nr:HAMP domain-containing histidine kinase [Myxococcales bacterium]